MIKMIYYKQHRKIIYISLSFEKYTICMGGGK